MVYSDIDADTFWGKFQYRYFFYWNCRIHECKIHVCENGSTVSKLMIGEAK